METATLIELGGSQPQPPAPAAERPTTNGNSKSGSQEILSNKVAEQMKQLGLESTQQVTVEVTSNGPPAQSAPPPVSVAPAAPESAPAKPLAPVSAKGSVKPGTPAPASVGDKTKPKTPSSITSQAKTKPSKQTNGNGESPTKASAITKRSPATTQSTGTARTKPAASPTTNQAQGTARTRPAASPTSNPVASTRAAASAAARRSASLTNSPSNAGGDTPEIKKVPMNKVKVGNTPSPNIKEVKSKIGSLETATTHKPGGGNVKIAQTKLNWKAESKIGSLGNVNYQPSGGSVKVKTPTVVETKKVEFKNVTSKIGSLQNVKHKPGGGEKKIFDDKEYLKQASASPSSKTPSEKGGSIPHSPTPRENSSMSATNVGASGEA